MSVAYDQKLGIVAGVAAGELERLAGMGEMLEPLK